MKKNKRIFGNLNRRPSSSNLKHKKKYIEDEYYDDDEEYFEDEEYYDEDEEYFEDEEYYDEDEEYFEDEEYYDEEVNSEEEEYYEEYSDDEEYYDEEHYSDDALDEVDYEENDAYEDYVEYDNSEEYYDDDYRDDEYYEESDEYYEASIEDVAIPAKEVSHSKKRSNKKRFDFKEWILDSFYNFDFMDGVLLVTTFLLVLFGALTVSTVATSNHVNDQIESFVPLGNTLVEIGIAGENGISSMVEAGLNGQLHGIIKAEGTDTEESDNQTEQEPQVEEKTDKAKINVNFESVEKDLKIRFKNSLTGDLITGIPFEVTITNKASGNSLTLVDDDKDGIIYKSGIKAGKFNAIITSTDKYKFSTTGHEITIKDKVEYVVINVDDEVKKENEIEVAKEDTEIKVAATETVETPAKVLKDTVEFVNPSKTSNGVSYTKIEKDKIADPGLKTSAISGNVKFDDFSFDLNKSEITLKVDETFTLSTGLEDSKDDNKIVKYVTSWLCAPESVANVDKGTVKAVSEGTAVVTCTVDKITIEKVEKTKTIRDIDNPKEISVDEYNALSEEEKKHCIPIYGPKESEDENPGDDNSEDGESLGDKLSEIGDKIKENTEIKGYKYTPEKEVTYTDEETKEEHATKTCKVTVKGPEAATIKSASFELDATKVTVPAGTTKEVKPSKLVYTMSDGTTKTITSDFPTIVWLPSDVSIATVNDKGVVTAVKAGNTTIKATLLDVRTNAGDTISQTVSVTVVDGLSLTLDKTTEQTLKVGDTLQIQPSVKNAVKDTAVYWSTSDEKIAKVSIGGLVTAVAPGTATITCKTGEKSAVTGKEVTQTVTIKVINSAAGDTASKLKDKSGNQVYVKDANGSYVEAVYADYYQSKEYYIKNAETFTYTGWQTINGKTYYYDKNGKVVTGSQVIQGQSYDFLADGSLKASANGGTRGIDISKWNGSVDWNEVKNSGIDFVIIRCGYRGSSSGALIEDPNFKTNMQGATQAGLKVGIYFFSQAIDEVEAVKEASFAISLAQNYRLTYPIFIDTEKSGGRADSLSTQTRTSIVNAFCQTVESAGFKAGIYASQTWFEQKLTTSSLQKYKIWIARYADTVSYSGKYDMWQYTAKGTVNGVSGKVDMNYSYLGY